MDNLYGKVDQSTETHNEAINKRSIDEERSPTPDRIAVSVNIDGVWAKKYDEKGKIVFEPNGEIVREYKAVPPDQLNQTIAYIQSAIGYKSEWGEAVTVTNIPFDRTEQFAEENAAIARQRQWTITILVAVGALALLVFGFIIIQGASRARERLRQRREAELARQAALERESALLAAEKEGQEVGLSVEDQQHMEIVEKAIQMAKEHPADVSQLIRTWLMEE
jgi:flagellar M-ring protein FliF